MFVASDQILDRIRLRFGIRVEDVDPVIAMSERVFHSLYDRAAGAEILVVLNDRDLVWKGPIDGTVGGCVIDEEYFWNRIGLLAERANRCVDHLGIIKGMDITQDLHLLRVGAPYASSSRPKCRAHKRSVVGGG